MDYTFYRDTYFGSQIAENDFPRLSARAEEVILSFERDYTVTGGEAARSKAICALAEAVQSTEKAASAALASDAIASESIGSVSVSYRPARADDAGIDLSERGTKKRYYDIARRYLDIKRGVR